MATFDKDQLREDCANVRSDESPLNWVAFTYINKTEVAKATEGEDYEQFKEFLTDNNDRVYGYVRIFTGDELSKRAKFAFITFYGSSCNPIAKAKCTTDKTRVRDACGDRAKEFLFDGIPMTHEEIVKELKKVGGANYDAQA